jgi:hypothetical protein
VARFLGQLKMQRGKALAVLAASALVCGQAHAVCDGNCSSDRASQSVLSDVSSRNLADGAFRFRVANEQLLARESRAIYFSRTTNISRLATGIQPSSDPEVLFNAFAEKYPNFYPDTDADRRSLTLPNPEVTSRGDEKTLAFMFLNLLRSNRIDAELVLAYEKADSILVNALTDHSSKFDWMLVYVPSVDRYFVPTLAPKLQRDFDRIMRSKTLLHIAEHPDPLPKEASACADTCLRLPRIIDGSLENHLVKIERIPAVR